MKNHLKHMVIGGAAILVVLLLVGVDIGQALVWAVLLACPVMMLGMMSMMNRAGSHEHGHAPSKSETEPATRAPELSMPSVTDERARLN